MKALIDFETTSLAIVMQPSCAGLNMVFYRVSQERRKNFTEISYSELYNREL